MDENIIVNMVRVGTVTSVDVTKRCVRVRFPDKKMTSGWLHVVKSSALGWMPSINDTVLCLYMPVFNGDGFVLGVL